MIVGCIRHSQASLPLLSFARLFRADAGARPYSCCVLRLHFETYNRLFKVDSKYYDMPLKNGALDNIEVMLSFNTSEAELDEVKESFKDLPKAKISKSQFNIRMK